VLGVEWGGDGGISLSTYRCLRVLHEALPPAQKAIKDVAEAELDGGHHSVAHSLSSDVAITDIPDVRRVCPVGCRVEERFILRVSEKQLSYRGVDTSIDVFGFVARFNEDVAVLASGNRTFGGNDWGRSRCR
jgi:hypothetical protein